MCTVTGATAPACDRASWQRLWCAPWLVQLHRHVTVHRDWCNCTGMWPCIVTETMMCTVTGATAPACDRASWQRLWRAPWLVQLHRHVTVHRDKFPCNKTNQMHQFHKFILTWNSTCFEQFLCPSSGVYSLYTQQLYMSYSFRAGPGWNCSSILVLLESCMTYTIAECTVNKLLMIDRGTVRNM